MAARARTHRLFVSAVTVGWLGFGTACQPPANADASTADEDAEEVAAPVTVGKVEAGEIEAVIRASSTIEAERQVTVHAESTGRVTLLEAEEGDLIEAGKLVAKIKQEVQRAGLDRANTSLQRTQEDLAVVRKLHEAGAASSDELRQAELALQTAKLDLRDRKRDLKNTRVTAPIAGKVTERFVNVGAFVTSGAQLVNIVDFSTLVARVYVPEKVLDRIEVGQSALVEGKAARGRKGEGTVARIAPVVDATTGTIKVTVSLPEALSGGDKGFLPGMYAEVTLTTDRHNGVPLVDKRALVYEDEVPYAFVVDGDRVKRVRLTLGLLDRDRAEVLEGLAVGAEVVLAGQGGLKDGSLVRRVEPADATAPGEGAAAQGASPSPDEGIREGEDAGEDEAAGEAEAGTKKAAGEGAERSGGA